MNPPFTTSRDAKLSKAFWLLIGAALLIRLWGISYGLPYVYWIDEYHEVMRAMELGSGEFDFERTGKGGFYFLLFVEFGLYFVALKIAGVVSTVQDFAEQFVRDPSMFYLMGRATAAVFGGATVAAAYWVAREAYLPKAGLLAGLFLAVNVVHVDLSHRVGVDVPMTLFATLALYFALRIAEQGCRESSYCCRF
jgi:4-amino-4-deoxy-L-arabinose transferase-like glycosyltransferase